jgi:RNA polymerase sigma factor (TIGR02999 family)
VAEPDPNVTQLLELIAAGRKDAEAELIAIVYGELRQIARRLMRREHSHHTLQTTALVHEAYLRLAGQPDVEWQNRAHLYGVAAQIMLRLLVDYGRTRRRAKRGGGGANVPLDEAVAAAAERDPDLVALDDALRELATVDAQQSRIVELRYFGGLTIEETAEVLGVSSMTVKRDWRVARAWLHRQLTSGPR